MCLGAPARIEAITAGSPGTPGARGIATADGWRREVDLGVLVCDVGDWVLIHAGCAIQQFDREAAEATWAELRALAEEIAAEGR